MECKDCRTEISEGSIYCKSCSKKGSRNPHYGKRLSDTTRKRMREARRTYKFKEKVKGKKSKNWRGGTYLVNGYLLIYAPEHPKAYNKRYYPEHRLVMEKHLGRYLRKEEVVHHINGIKNDNRIENLMLFPNNKAHFKWRHIMKSFICKHCGGKN